jgi:galactokinase
MARMDAVTVSAPGRVNLIGEHTDYSLLPVLPIAIQKRLRVHAERTDDGVVEARSTRFEGVFRSDRTQNPAWTQYLTPIVELAGTGGGALLTVQGDLPPTGGLSSSSALTVASLLALLRLDDHDPDSGDLVDLAIRAERATGVEGGAMDQTVIVNAEAGTALRIDFAPITWRPVSIPDDVAFVVGYSGTPAPKGGWARDAYNARVVGTRTAAAILGADPPFLAYVRGPSDDAIASLPETASPLREAARLTSGVYDATDPLPVRAWARHVLTEAERVEQATDALERADVGALGRLFDESHTSLATDFGVSTPQLDLLTDVARDAGAAGARLTGAGFGGWGVAVCRSSHAGTVAGAMASVAGQAFRVEASAGVE